MTIPRRPPRLARYLLARTLPPDSRDEVLGDLEELFQKRSDTHGPGRARLWYWKEAFAFSTRFVWERVRDGASGLASRPLLPSVIDVKLGGRMLIKSPLLTVTGCVAIATAIAINAGFHEFMGDMFSLMQAVPDGERVVAITQHDVAAGNREDRILSDIVRWNEQLETVERIGALIRLDMNLVGTDGRATPVDAGGLSASTFELAGGVPKLGRPLLPSDDRPDAEPVAVVGHHIWTDYLGGEADVIGSTIRLGETVYTVVGVMPPGFHFPVGRQVWLNLRRDPRETDARTGPATLVVGRLAPGRSLEQAQAELDQLANRVAAEQPDTHARLRPRVQPLESLFKPVDGDPGFFLLAARIVFALMLVVAAANVAALVYARNAARQGEIAIRTALGASRMRIVTQLFAEAMVLALLGAGVGLVLAQLGLQYGSQLFWDVQRMAPPFWWDTGLSLQTVLYSMALAALGGGIVGIVPGLRTTRCDARTALTLVGSGGNPLAFGILPTTIIVLQVALSVAFIPVALANATSQVTEHAAPVSFETGEYVTARLRADGSVTLGVQQSGQDQEPLLRRFRTMRESVRRRLEEEPGVGQVVFTDRLPGLLGQSIPSSRLEVESRPEQEPMRVMTARVEFEYFDVLGRSVVTGRPFSRADYAGDGRVALVNQRFVREVFGSQNPVGHRVRPFMGQQDPDRPWTEIVGVVPEEVAGPSGRRPQIYYPMPEAGAVPARMLVHVDGNPSAFAARLRSIMAETEPGVLVDEIYPLDEVRRGEVLSELFFVVILVFVAFITMLLSVMGVYSLMSFIVSQRTREIGIRTALGADVGRILRAVFSRALGQLGLGAVLGGVIATWILRGETASEPTIEIASSIGGVALLLIAVGAVGCAIPLARAIRIQPTEALNQR